MNTYDWVYTIVPYDYIPVYHAILEMMSSYGEAMLKDCKAKCADKNENVIDCYNMFNGAVASYRTGKKKLADTIIKYLKAKIKQIANIDCDNAVFLFRLGVDNDIEALIEVVDGKINIKQGDISGFYIFKSDVYNMWLLAHIPEYINPYTHKKFIQIFEKQGDSSTDNQLATVSVSDNEVTINIVDNISDATVNGILEELSELGFSNLTPGLIDNNNFTVHNGDVHSPQNTVYTKSEIEELMKNPKYINNQIL